MKKTLFILLLIVVSILGCENKRPYVLTGRTMGTVYHITVISSQDPSRTDLAGQIEHRLMEINQSMSLFDKTSELTRFNNGDKDETFCMTPDFKKVFMVGRNLFHITDGAWDGSVGPLVNLWGFGYAPAPDVLPSDDVIGEALARTGFDRIEVKDDQCLIKHVEGLILDFGSIAKGYAVDEITGVLEKNGYMDSLVEIGGEVRASGSKDGADWVVGINTPSPDAAADDVFTAITLHEQCIATSGDYRNFREAKGNTYTHVIDPKTGRPVTHHVASVSVLADNTTFADGLATALMVMGKDKGLALVNRLTNVECLFIIRGEDGRFAQFPSSGWPEKKGE